MRRVAIFVLPLVLGACAQFSAAPYDPSTGNVMTMQSATGEQKLAMAPYDVAKGVETELRCRAGTIHMPHEQSVSAYLTEALKTELRQAAAYSEDASVKIEPKLTELGVSTTEDPSWQLSATISASTGKSYSVAVKHSFRSSYLGDKACKSAANAFLTAVRKLNAAIVEHEKFANLVGRQ